MKKTMKKLFCVLFATSVMIADTTSSVSINSISVKANETASDETMQGAILLELDKEATCLFEGNVNNEAHYFKFIAPNDTKNQWFSFTTTNYTNKNVYSYLLDSNGEVLAKSKSAINSQKEWSITTRTLNTGTSSNDTIFLVPGNIYYIKIQSTSSNRPKGSASVSVKTTSDDNWGTYDKADEITLDNWKNGTLEKNDDIDYFYVKLPNDNHTYTFNISSDNEIIAAFTDDDRSNLGKVSVLANDSSNSFTQTGKGQIIYIRVQSGSSKTISANYSIKVNLKKEINNDNNSSTNDTPSNNTDNNTNNIKSQKISTLYLSTYKKGTKKVIGKTIKAATVKVKVSGNTYTVKSNNSGKFTAKLVSKLKSGAKITVTASKKNYITCTRSFFVK